MKYRGTTLICTTVLTILLGIGIGTQTVKADTTTVLPTEQTTTISTTNQDATTADNGNSETEIADDQPSNTVGENSETPTDIPNSSLVVEDPNKDKTVYPGGDWDVDPATATPQQNFYYYVNGKWIAENPAGTKGTFETVGENVNDQLIDYFNGVIDGSITDATPDIQKIVAYYQNDLALRQTEDPDVSEVKDGLKVITSINSYQDLSDHLGELSELGITLPFSFFYGKDKSGNPILTVDSPGVIDPRASYNSNRDYIDKSLKREKLSQEVLRIGLKKLGYQPDEINKIITEGLTFDNVISHTSNWNTTMAASEDDSDSKFPEMDTAQLEHLMRAVPVNDFLQKYYPNQKKIRLMDSTFLKSFNSIFVPGNFERMKSWMIDNYVLDNNRSFGKSAIESYFEMANLDGATYSAEEMALADTEYYFGSLLSVFYGKTFFGAENREKATQLVDSLVDSFRERLKNNSWLSQATIDKSIEKLDNMNIRVGYPDTIPETADYTKADFSKDDTYLSMETSLKKFDFLRGVYNFNNPDAEKLWPSPSYNVNSFYGRTDNSINILAGILQKPFFDETKSDSANLGAIGVIIGHEITHGFDDTGSQYDAHGNLDDWWTKADKQKFDEMVEKIVKEYDGIPYKGYIEDGEMTVGENIADNGGLNLALQVAKQSQNYDPKEFFESFANSFKSNYTTARLDYLANNDEHSFDPLRINVSLQNIDDFYTTYNIKPGDPMYLKPSKRVNIW